MTYKAPPSKFHDFLNLLPTTQRGELTRPNDVCIWEINVKIDNTIKRAFEKLQKEGLSKENLHCDTNALKNNKLIVKYEFSVNDRIFIDLNDFKRNFLKAREVFYELFIFDTFTFQKDESEIAPELKIFYTRYFNLEKILKIFSNNSHHYEKSKDYMLYIDPSSDTENANIKLVSKLSKLSNHYNLLDQDIEFKSLKTFEDDVDITRPNVCVREKAILRNTLLDFISDKSDQSNIFDESSAILSTYNLLNSHEDFDNKFDANLQIYLKDISIDKLKLEITTEQLKCSDQVSKIIQDVISKVFIMSSIQILIVILLRKDQLSVFENSNIITSSFFIVLASFFTLLSLYSNASQLYLVEQSINVVNEKIKNQLNTIPKEISIKQFKGCQIWRKVTNFLGLTEKNVTITELFMIYKKGIKSAKILFTISIGLIVLITKLLTSFH